MIIRNVLVIIITLFIFPTIVGHTGCRLLKYKEANLAKCFCLGTFVQWGLFQLIAVPLVLLCQSFTLLVWLVSVIYVSVLILSCLIKFKTQITFFSKAEGWKDIIPIICLMIVFGMALYFLTAYQHINDDDSRFVVNIIDIIRTNTLFLTNPGTGEPIAVRSYELLRDVVSPWAAFQAYIAYLSGIHPTVFAHLIHPLALYVLLFGVQWELSSFFVGEKIAYRCAFCIFLWVLLWFGEYTGWSAEGFVLYGVWHGKAIVAGICIPYMICLMIQKYGTESKGELAFLLITNMAMCLLSNMGILFGCLLTGIFGLVYGIQNKKLRICISIWMTAIPNVIYGILSLVI